MSSLYAFGTGRGAFGGGKPWPVGATSTATIKGGMAVSVAAGADAVGTDTWAALSSHVAVVDRGLISYSFGTIETVAAASAGDDELVYASAYAMVDVAGADIVSATTTETVRAASAGGVSIAGHGAETRFLAVDLKWVSSGPPAEQQTRTDITSLAVVPSGNVASFEIAALAVGDASHIEVGAGAIAVEDGFSSTTASVVATVGGETSYRVHEGSHRAEFITTTGEDGLVWAGGGHDQIWAHAGNDWIFAEEGKDTVDAGTGDDTVFGGDGDDCLAGGCGDDWIFGGAGRDVIGGGTGNDLLLGGDGNDLMDGGEGDDLMDGGRGADIVRAGGGNDVLWLGGPARDGNDTYWGAAGADTYLIGGQIDRAVIADLQLSEGDHLLLLPEGWGGESDLAIDSDMVTLRRGPWDANDLLLTFDVSGKTGQLALDDFFLHNAGYGAMPRRGAFSEARTERILEDLFGHDEHGPEASFLFEIGRHLSDLG